MAKIYLLITLLVLLRLGYYHFVDRKLYVNGQSLVLTGRLDREPLVVSGKQKLFLSDFLIYLPLRPSFHFGDELSVTGLVRCPQKEPQCLSGILTSPSVSAYQRLEPNPWLAFARQTRKHFQSVYVATLETQKADLLAGIVLGGSDLRSDFKKDLTDVGLTHVVAASGMNITIFSGAILAALKAIHSRKIYIVVIGIGFVIFYATITGFEPPIVRASLMAILSFLATLIGRESTGLAGLVISAIAMLWVSPKLLYDPAFLLSFSSMTGQIYLSNQIGAVTKLPKIILGYCLQTVVAIIFTFPFVVYFFSRFSLVAIFTNFFLLWTVEPLMILGGLAGIFATVSLELARLIALPTAVLLGYFLGVVDVFSQNFPVVLKLPQLDLTFIFGYYLALAGFLLWGQRRGILPFSSKES